MHACNRPFDSVNTITNTSGSIPLQTFHAGCSQRDIVVEGLSFERVFRVAEWPEIVWSQIQTERAISEFSDPKFIRFVGSQVSLGRVEIEEMPLLSAFRWLTLCLQQSSPGPCQRRSFCRNIPPDGAFSPHQCLSWKNQSKTGFSWMIHKDARGIPRDRNPSSLLSNLETVRHTLQIHH
jgi:hypothetical protein